MSTQALLSFIDSETGETSNILADRYVDADTICGQVRDAELAIDPELDDTYRCVHYHVGDTIDTFIVEQTSKHYGGEVIIMLTGVVYRSHARTGTPGRYLRA